MLILLDIDGVMVPASAWKRPEFLNDGFPAFNNRATEALEKIISETSATLLLTTSHKSNYSISEWNAIFKLRGIIVTKIERLEGNSLNTNRKDEILNWFSSTNSKEKFVIIDDDKSLNALPSNLKEKLVLTSPLVGLTMDMAFDAIAILKQEEMFV